MQLEHVSQYLLDLNCTLFNIQDIRVHLRVDGPESHDERVMDQFYPQKLWPQWMW